MNDRGDKQSASVLRGVKVLDLGTLYPAPFAAAMLGDFGADVVKVEPSAGDPVRKTGIMRNGQAVAWSLFNRNKRGFKLDFDKTEGLSLLTRLTDVADVIVVNQPRKILERWNCTYNQVAARNPRAIMVSVSGFGDSGPYADRAAAGTLAEAFAGLTHMIGEADGPPTAPSFPLGDYMGALSGFLGALLALYGRDANGGQGQLVDASMYEALLPMLGPILAIWQPGQTSPMRTGSRMPGAVPRNVYKTSDNRWVELVASTDAQATRILEVMEALNPETTARFGRSTDRIAHGDELDSMVAHWVATRDAATVMKVLLEARIPSSEVNDLARVVEDPHVRFRKAVVSLNDPVVGPITMAAPAPHLTRTPGAISREGPALGAHTEEICREWLRFSDAEISRLKEASVI
jgi:crotonobetainyl-CoA:carnitine CoA-transferase CaiB-like acyl-CoA transferase